MEKTTTNQISKKVTATPEVLVLEKRQNLHIEGILEVVSTSENGLTLKLKDTVLILTGNNIHITKLDVNTGIIDAVGSFNMIKYGKSRNIFKRVFR